MAKWDIWAKWEDIWAKWAKWAGEANSAGEALGHCRTGVVFNGESVFSAKCIQMCQHGRTEHKVCSPVLTVVAI